MALPASGIWWPFNLNGTPSGLESGGKADLPVNTPLGSGTVHLHRGM